MAIDLIWLARVRRHIIAADVNGLTFKELLKKVRTPQHPTADLREALGVWRKRRWVDNYEVPSTGNGKNKQIWRGTQLLLDEWPVMVATMHAALYDPRVAYTPPAAESAPAPIPVEPEVSSPPETKISAPVEMSRPIGASQLYRPRSS